MTTTCHYTTLGVERTATREEIVAAYRRMAMKWHPDRHVDPAKKHEAEQHFKRVQQAYTTLSDPSARATYDQSQSRPDPFGFGFGFGAQQTSRYQQQQQEWARHAEDAARRQRENMPRGADIKKKVSISLADAINGTTIEVDHPRQAYCEECDDNAEVWQTCLYCSGTGRTGRSTCWDCMGRGGAYVRCPQCKGTGVVTETRPLSLRLPAGVIDGAQLVARERGKPSRHNGLPGDLVVTVSIKPEHGWKFKGAQIDGTLKINFSTAMFGGKVTVELPQGKTAQVTIPARTNSGKRIRLEGMGLHDRQTGERGNAILTTSIVLPSSRKKVSPAVEHLLRDLDQGLDV